MVGVVAVVWLFSLAVVAGVARQSALSLLIVGATLASSLIRCRGSAWHAVALGVTLAGACVAIGWVCAARLAGDGATVERVAAAAGAARVELRGWVCSFPQATGNGCTFDFATRLEGRGVTVQVRAEFFDVHYGDEYLLRARLVRSSRAGMSYLRSRGLAGSARVRLRDAVRVGGSHGGVLARGVFWPLHRGTRVHLQRVMGRDAGLAIGMLLGERAQLGDATRDAVRRLGISHLLAISGMHLTSIAGCIVLATSRCRRWTVPALAAALSVYTGVVGDVESLTRAYVMSLLLMAAHATIRPVRPLDALAKTLFVMALASPLSMRSVGLQLSFAATFALLAMLPGVRAWWTPREVRRPFRVLLAIARSVAVAFLISLGVEVFIAPLQLHHFGSLSVVGPVATVVFLVPLTAILLASAPVAACATILPVGEWMARALAAVSTATIDLIAACGRLAPAPLRLPEPDPWLYYAGLALAFRFRRRPLAWVTGAGLMVLAFLRS